MPRAQFAVQERSLHDNRPIAGRGEDEAEALTQEGRRAFRDDLIALATASNHATDGTLVSDWEFLITVATRA